MTIRFVTAWNGYYPDQIVSGLGSTEETRLINNGFAVSDLDGPGNTPTPVFATKDLTGRMTASAGGVDFLSAAGVTLNTIHPAYICHLYAGNLTADDSKFIDSTGQNDGVRGANLSIAQMGANAGYATAIGPLTGSLDSVIHLPITGFDFNSGEALLFYWRGKAAAPAAQRTIMGDMQYAYGIKTRIDTSGYVDMMMYGAGGSFQVGTSSNTVADGTVHDFAFFVDGRNKRVYKWVDGSLALTATSYAAASGDAKSLLNWNIGCSAGLLDQTGVNCSTRLFAMLRWGATSALPDVTALTTAIQRLRANPGRLLTVSDL